MPIIENTCVYRPIRVVQGSLSAASEEEAIGMPKDLSKLPARELAALSGAEDEDMLEEQWWEHQDDGPGQEVASKTA